MKKKILVIDDDPDVAGLISLKLRVNNYEVIRAADGIKAIVKANITRPDLILLDIRMPAADGFSVHNNLKLSRDTEHIPVIFVTGQEGEDVKNHVLGKGAVDFIKKPFDPNELIAKIKKALGETGAPQQPAMEAVPARQQLLQGKKILVIDDDPNMVKILHVKLSRKGYEVITATDSMQGLRQAHKEKPGLIVLDIMMPAGGGFSLFNNLKLSLLTTHIPVIFTTASTSREWREKAQQLGAEAYIQKPFETDRLIELIQGLLTESGEG